MAELTNKQIVDSYIDGVLSGEIIASKPVRAACQRHREDLKSGSDRGIYFDEDTADRMCQFFPMLKHTAGEYSGQPFVLKPWQTFVVWCLFGWRKVSNSMRRFTEAYLSLGRGNGKSAFAAALLLLCSFFDAPIEMQAENYTFATKEDQAAIVFNDAKSFVDGEPQLHGYIKRLKKSLFAPTTKSSCRPLGSDSDNSDGLRPHCVVTDELHAWREKHRELWNKIVTALAKRLQSLMIIITTAGSDDSLLWIEKDDLAREVVSREVEIEDDALFVFIAEIDEGDDPFDEDNWHKANPMLTHGVVKVDPLRRMAADAKRKPDVLKTFTRYHCNRRVSSAEQLINAKRWKQGDKPPPSLAGKTCHSGFDWGWRDDLTALAHVFPLDHVDVEGDMKRRYAIEVDCWVPDGSPHDLTSEPWAGFIRRGELEITSGSTTDTTPIYDRLQERMECHAIASIAMDGNNAREFGTKCQNEYGLESFYFGQSCGKYNEPLMELLAALDEGRILHGANTLLAWCARNMVTVEDARGYRMPAKKKCRQKIDPIVAVIMALSECMFAEREEVISDYDQPGSFFV